MQCAVVIKQYARLYYFVNQDTSKYNALEQDLAVVNLYFGSSTVYGQSSDVQDDASLSYLG